MFTVGNSFSFRDLYLSILVQIKCKHIRMCISSTKLSFLG